MGASIAVSARPGALGSGVFPHRPEKLYLGVPADHALAGRASVSLRVLSGEKLLALGQGHRLLENVRHLADASGRASSTISKDQPDAIRQMVSIGMGLSVFPELYARAQFSSSRRRQAGEFDDWNEQREVGPLYWREASGREHHYRTLQEIADGVAASLGFRNRRVHRWGQRRGSPAWLMRRSRAWRQSQYRRPRMAPSLKALRQPVAIRYLQADLAALVGAGERTGSRSAR